MMCHSKYNSILSCWVVVGRVKRKEKKQMHIAAQASGVFERVNWIEIVWSNYRRFYYKLLRFKTEQFVKNQSQYISQVYNFFGLWAVSALSHLQKALLEQCYFNFFL